MWFYSLIRLVVGTVFLGVAAYTDLKTRRADDKIWQLMGTIAVLILIIELFQRKTPISYYLVFFPILFLLVEATVDRPPLYEGTKWNYLLLGWFLVPIVSVIMMFYIVKEFTYLFWSLLAIPIVMSLAFIFYYFRVIYGGADAKAMVTLAVLLPFYPDFIVFLPELLESTYTIMEVFFPFTLVILLNSALIVLVLPIAYLMLNVKQGDIRFPQMFFGYKKNLNEISKSFVWPMEYYKDGKRHFELMPRYDEDKALASLKKAGRKTIWVTPKIPFLVPMFFGFMLSFIWGNPMLLLM